jgi:hypothetical protein
MTRRIAIVGTSNIGALKHAAPAIATEFPDLALAFWGLPGGKFADCAVDAAGCLRTAPDDAEALRMARRINGADTIDMSRADARLVIADTMGLPQILFVACGYDVVDWPHRRDKPLMSEAAFRAVMDEVIEAAADDLARRFQGVTPLFVARAPYPTTVVTRRGPLRLEPFASVASHPELARIEGLYTAALDRALSARAMSLVPQPPETIAAPFLTRPEFGQAAGDFRAADRVLDDHRHMNAAFGTSLFRAFALALGPGKAGHPPTAQIKE